MKMIIASLLFTLSLSASATTYFNCKITELDEVGSPISIGNEVTVSVADANPKTTVIGSSNGRQYNLSFSTVESYRQTISTVNICFGYDSRCTVLGSARNSAGSLLIVNDLVNAASVSCIRL
ncbi:hypothetical protein SHI21_08335 [Bacteriovorax sp. PP10]|uniref:Uncharacterized protein n=1 Tax=Bacteriovorax antarcticus TaxID=3088717 RepID=A0ABU5VT84_9BACT|nr:hypothetical protein [Bacteriovorax sp. PP10]MEA9356206.1 hypothetical protein [Bacteriovorax sp. PP10]